MENYKFIAKPLFFIFNLLFATWLVIYIERLEPSDFGRYESLFQSKTDQEKIDRDNKDFLMYLAKAYKAGDIDSVKLSAEFDRFLKPDDKK